MSRTRVHNLSISLDGFATGEPQSAEEPFWHAGQRLHEWMFGTRFWRPDGNVGVDDAFAQRHSEGIGAEIMGAHKFSPHRGPWQDHEWQGWWGAEPPFHTPVFVMTHHPRPSFTLSDTTFHFVDAEPATVLDQARGAAQGRDVRLGGGATVIRQFLAADLVDTMHVAVSPVELGSGVRLWTSPDELLDRFHLDVVPSPSGVTHHLFWRK